MSDKLKTLTCRDLCFNVTDRRLLLNKLELYYLLELKTWKFFEENRAHRLNKTKLDVIRRRWRISIKSMEVLLKALDSPIMSNVKSINHRQTTAVNAVSSGLAQNDKQILANIYRVRKTRRKM